MDAKTDCRYIPTVDDARTLYRVGVMESLPDVSRAEAEAEFDGLIARVRAEAWDEGWRHARRVFTAEGAGPRTRNPYRA